MGKFVCCLTLVWLAFCLNLHAKTYNCDNLSFERGNFTNWTGKTWIHFYSQIFNLEDGIEKGRHTIMSDTTAYDANTGGKLKIVPPGYKYCARLGDAINGCLSQSLSYTMTVDSTNALFIWKFAVVLQDPLHDHLPEEQPHFKIDVEDQDGKAVSSCSQYDVNASENIPGFQTYTPPGFTRDTDSVALVVWRDWTTAGANLMPFYGKKITITFTAEDCTRQGHYGYAYFVAESHPMEITVNYCKDDVNARLNAPEGFYDYVWTPGNIQGRTLTVNNATPGDQYQCTFRSVMGCEVHLAAVIRRTTPSAAFEATQAPADKRTYRFANHSTTTSGFIGGYHWDFGDGSTSSEINPNHTFRKPGKYSVILEATSYPSECKNITSKEIVIEGSPLTIKGDTLICAGEKTTLTASGKKKYLWSTGSSTDSIIVTGRGTYRVIGWDEYGNSDTAYVHIAEKATPVVTISGHAAFCPGQSTTLTASGADTYKWNTYATSASISISTAGTYSVVGYLNTGCASKVISIDIAQSGDLKTTITGDSVFCANSQTTLTAVGGASYKWSNGSTQQSITVNESGTYIVIGTNQNGCQSQASVHVSKLALPKVAFKISNNSIDSNNTEITARAEGEEEGIRYEWKINDMTLSSAGSLTHRMNTSSSPKSYAVTLNAVDNHGCVSSISQMVSIGLHIPNVFTPNYDGYNDLFMPDYDLQVFDRNGKLLFSGTKGWDGTFNGSKMDPDTYFYLVKYDDENNNALTKKGYVTLVR